MKGGMNIPQSGRPEIPPELVRLACEIASFYFLPGETDGDEIAQVAMIGAWYAVRDYRPGHGTTLQTFARMTIRRALVDAIKAANRERRLFERAAIRDVDVDGETWPACELAEDPRGDVIETIAARQELARIRGRLPSLTRRERSVLIGSAFGLSYPEMSDRPVCDKAALSAVDNAYARAREKLAA